MEEPRNLGPATCPQRYPINTRPGALCVGGGGGEGGFNWATGGRGAGGRGVWWPKWGRGHPPRERELARGALPTSPKPVGVPVRRSLRKGIWLQWASRNKKNEPSARRLQRDERAPTRDRARGPDRPRWGTQDGPSRSPPPDRDSGSWGGVRQSHVRRPRPTRAR